jgi:ribosomal protein L29
VEKPHLIKEIRRNRARLFTQLQTLQQQAS